MKLKVKYEAYFNLICMTLHLITFGIIMIHQRLIFFSVSNRNELPIILNLQSFIVKKC